MAELQEARTYSLNCSWLQYDWDKEWLPGHSSGTRSLAASRHLYETVLRKFVLRISNLKVQTSAAVNGLAYNAEEQRVTGLQNLPESVPCSDTIYDNLARAQPRLNLGVLR